VTTAVTGERLALGATAVAIVALPVIQPTGIGNSSPVDLLIVGALGAWLLWAGFTHERQRVPYAASMTVFILGGTLGALNGPVPTAGLLALVQDVALLLWCTAVVNVARSPQAMRLLLRTWAWSSIVWASVLFAALFTGENALAGITARNGSRVSLTFGDPNVAANYFFISIMIMWAVGCPRRRAGRVAATAMLVFAMVLTGSIGGFLSLLVGTATAALFAMHRRYGVMPAIVLVCALGLFVYVGSSYVHIGAIAQWAHNSDRAWLRDSIGRGVKSSSDRELLLAESVRLIYQGGPLGQGPVSTKPRLAASQAPFVKEAHDDYLAALTERGVIGELGLLLLVASILFRTWSTSLKPLAGSIAGELRSPPAIAGAVAGTLVEGFSYEVMHFRHVWALWGVVAALYFWGRK
jgi:O-antigen ligase